MRIVIAYDIANDRRRIRIQRALLAVGDPVQESLFECELTSREFQRVRERIGRIADAGEDNVRYYPLCKDCLASIWTLDGPLEERETQHHVV